MVEPRPKGDWWKRITIHVLDTDGDGRSVWQSSGLQVISSCKDLNGEPLDRVAISTDGRRVPSDAQCEKVLMAFGMRGAKEEGVQAAVRYFSRVRH